MPNPRRMPTPNLRPIPPGTRIYSVAGWNSTVFFITIRQARRYAKVDADIHEYSPPPSPVLHVLAPAPRRQQVVNLLNDVHWCCYQEALPL